METDRVSRNKTAPQHRQTKGVPLICPVSRTADGADHPRAQIKAGFRPPVQVERPPLQVERPPPPMEVPPVQEQVRRTEFHPRRPPVLAITPKADQFGPAHQGKPAWLQAADQGRTVQAAGRTADTRRASDLAGDSAPANITIPVRIRMRAASNTSAADLNPGHNSREFLQHIH